MRLRVMGDLVDDSRQSMTCALSITTRSSLAFNDEFSMSGGGSSLFRRHDDEAPPLFKSQPQIWAIDAEGEQLAYPASWTPLRSRG